MNRHYIPSPAIPEANEEVVWFDTGDAGYSSAAGVVGDMFFDQEVTMIVRTAPQGGDLRVMNGDGGAGVTVAADTPTPLAVKFVGYRTQIVLKVGATPPTIWHANARLTDGPV